MTSTGFGRRGVAALAGAALALASAGAYAAPTQTTAGTAPKRAGNPAKSPAAARMAGSARGFVQNGGQWDARAKFMARSQGMALWLEGDGLVLDYSRPRESGSKYLGHAIRMGFVGGRSVAPKGEGKLGFTDVIRKDGVKRSGKYGKVRSKGVYRGIDFVAYFQGDAPRYDFVVAPGADPNLIALDFKGATHVREIDRDTLGLGTSFGEQKLDGLFAYQMVKGKKVAVPVSFRVTGGKVGFALGAYDRSRELVIDPLIYGTYFGGDNGFDEVRAVTSDTTGGVFLTGYTKSASFPVLYGPYGFNLRGGRDAFLAKLQGDAYDLDYSALIPASGDEQGNYLTTDTAGNVWLLGSTTSNDFPNGFAGNNTFLMRFRRNATTVLDPFGLNGSDTTPVIYRFGANSIQRMAGLGISRTAPAAGQPTRIVLAGTANGTTGVTQIAGRPSSGAFYMTLTFNASGQFGVDQVASGYVPVRADAALSLTGLAVQGNGDFVLNGTLGANGNSDTSGPNPIFQTTPNVFPNGRDQRNVDTWVRKYSAAGGLAYSALVGGSANDFSQGAVDTRNVVNNRPVTDVTGTTCAVDDDGNAYILGVTNSFDFPRTRGVVGEVFNGSAFTLTVTKINTTGSALLYSTSLNTGGITTGGGISVDPRGVVYVTGLVDSANVFNGTPADPNEPNAAPLFSGTIPTTADAIRPAYITTVNPQIKSTDGFLLALNSDATQFIHGTYIGGLLDDQVFAPYTDRFGDTFVCGWSDSSRFYSRVASTGGTPQLRYTSGARLDGFITALAFKANPEIATGPSNADEAETNVAYGFGNAGDQGGGAQPQTFGIRFRRDGFVLRYRLSLPLISSFTLNPTVLPGGDATGTGNPAFTIGTITLSSPAPEAGASIRLTISDGTYASFDPGSVVTETTVQIPAGATTVTLPIYSRPTLDQQNVQIRADYQGSIKVATLAVRPYLRALTVSPTTVIGGNSSSGAIRLETVAPAPGVPVVLSTDRPDVISFPTSPVIVPTGSATTTFTYNALPVDAPVQAQINASLLGVTRTELVTIVPARLNRIEFNPSSVAAGSVTTGTIFLDGKAKTARTIVLTVPGAPAGYSLNPSTVVIPAGGDRASFELTTGFENATTSRSVQARQVANGVTVDGPVTGTLTVVAARVASVTATPLTVASGGALTVEVTLANAAPTGGVNVTLTSSRPDLVPIPGLPNGLAVFFAAGEQTKTITLPKIGTNLTGANVPVQINAYRTGDPNGNPVSTTVIVLPVSPTLTISPNSVIGGSGATGTVSIGTAQNVPVTVQLSSNNAAATVPTSVTIPAGATSVSFPIATSAIPVTTVVTISASIGGGTPATAELTIRTVQVVSLRLTPAFIRSGQTTLLTVTLDGPVAQDTVIPLTFSNDSLVSFGSVVVPAGQSSVSVRSTPASRVPRTLTTSISASLGGTTATTTLTVQR